MSTNHLNGFYFPSMNVQYGAKLAGNNKNLCIWVLKIMKGYEAVQADQLESVIWLYQTPTSLDLPKKKWMAVIGENRELNFEIQRPADATQCSKV